MPHLEPDRLVPLALGANSAEAFRDEATAGHLLECGACRRELDDLRTVAGVARGTQEVRDLPLPPPRVWAAVAAATSRTPEKAGTGRRAPSWPATALMALGAAVVAAGGTAVALWAVRPGPAACERNVASLAPLPAAPAGAKVDACLVTAGGERKVRVRATGLPVPPTGSYEVWLLDPTSLRDPAGPRMKSLGNLGSAVTEDFTVPANTDLSRYDIVDISAEPDDGDTAYSGTSLLRGALPPD